MSNVAGTLRVSIDRPARPERDHDLLARFHFGAPDAPDVGADRCMALPGTLGMPRSEEWRVAGPVEHGMARGIRHSIAAQSLVLSWSGDPGGDLRGAAREVYGGLCRRLRELRYPYIVKAWNHVPGITRGEGDLECYRQFCLGRGEVLDTLAQSATLPAGTAVGGPPGAPLQVVVLASRVSAYGLENPRQLSAFRYPRRYGPHSPSFSRAAITARGQLVVSGTASIVGHESRFRDDLAEQVRETLRNWRSLLHHAAAGSGCRPLALEEVTAFRAYVRHPGDHARVQELLEDAGIDTARVVFLQADICRPELLFELDGIADLPGPRRS